MADETNNAEALAEKPIAAEHPQSTEAPIEAREQNVGGEVLAEVF